MLFFLSVVKHSQNSFYIIIIIDKKGEAKMFDYELVSNFIKLDESLSS